MDLGLEITPRILGRASNPLQPELVRALRVEDLELLALPRDTAQAPALKRLSERHHAVARLLAKGMKPGEVAAIVSYTPNRIGILQNDPAFRELINFYRTDEDRELRSNFERLTGLAATAADELQDRLETEPEKISSGQLIEIVKVAADRSGNGPVTGNVNVDVRVDLASKLKAAREQARRASREVLTIEGTPAVAAE